MIHLFGVLYAQQLENLRLRDILELADLPASHEATIKDGMNLAEYVEVKSLRADS